MSKIITIATQDGHWLARCSHSGRVASGRTKVHALNELARLSSEVKHHA